MLQIIMPMGGEGKRFAERGYTFPKPLIEIAGDPMIEVVVRNVIPKEPCRFVFVCKEEYLTKFALAEVLRLLVPEAKVVPMKNKTAGALCSVLLGMEHLQNDNELLIVNADQYVDVSIDDMLATARAANADGCIMTFPSTHPKWSYVKVEDGSVVAVAEKRPISNNATVGIYYFRRSRDFVAAAERLLLKSAQATSEFYVCPVYNELILMGKNISIYPIERSQMHSLGTPEDLDAFVALRRNQPALA